MFDLAKKYSESIENFYYGLNEVFKSFEVVNVNDDSIMYVCVFLIAVICLFVIYALTNFYQLKPLKLDEKLSQIDNKKVADEDCKSK